MSAATRTSSVFEDLPDPSGRLTEACGARAEVEARIVELEATAHDALQAAPIAEDARAALHALAAATVWRAT